ncbi:MAG: formylmethanofuran dehydrogenase [Gammaproteobacteria bacterium]
MNPATAASPTAKSDARTHTSVTCPFCSLLCDDLEIADRGGKLTVSAGDCARARGGFEREYAVLSPQADGSNVSMEKAVAAAAKLLRGARHPLFGGLGTDVAGMRGLLALADRTGGIVDHMLGDTMYRNILAMQDRGWVMTTMTEVRNRADVVVFANLDAVSDHPRFFERSIWNADSMFGLPTRSRQIVYLGDGLNTNPGVSPDGRKPLHLKNEPERLGELIGALRALLAGQSLQADTVAGVKVGELAKLLEIMKAAKYGVIIWSPPRLPFASADLIVEAMCDLVKELNAHTRFSGFALGGNEGILTAGAVCAWQSGYQLRTDFGTGYPEFDPTRNATARLLENDDVDLLLWTSTFLTGQTPPRTKAPTILLAPPLAGLETRCAVYIPVGTPGVDHRGQMCRADNVVSLPLHQVRESALPSVASVCNLLLQSL